MNDLGHSRRIKRHRHETQRCEKTADNADPQFAHYGLRILGTTMVGRDIHRLQQSLSA
jgi:hypothetical protein